MALIDIYKILSIKLFYLEIFRYKKILCLFMEEMGARGVGTLVLYKS